MLVDRIISPFAGNGTYFWQLLYNPGIKLIFICYSRKLQLFMAEMNAILKMILTPLNMPRLSRRGYLPSTDSRPSSGLKPERKNDSLKNF
jgi:hypothetical protein